MITLYGISRASTDAVVVIASCHLSSSWPPKAQPVSWPRVLGPRGQSALKKHALWGRLLCLDVSDLACASIFLINSHTHKASSCPSLPQQNPVFLILSRGYVIFHFYVNHKDQVACSHWTISLTHRCNVITFVHCWWTLLTGLLHIYYKQTLPERSLTAILSDTISFYWLQEHCNQWNRRHGKLLNPHFTCMSP